MDGAGGARAERAGGDVLAAIALGGALGSLARHAVAEALPHEPGSLAWSTVLVNLTGCLGIGLLMAVVLAGHGPRLLRPLVGVGLLGGWTTFSTAMLDLRDLLAAGRPGVALLYLVVSLGAGLLAVVLGLVAVRALPAGRTTSP